MGAGCSSKPKAQKTTTSTPKAVFHALFIGPPGVGKGTVCDKLKKECSYAHISTGDLVRAEIKNQTELGLKIKEIAEAGGLVPDDIICDMLINHLKSIPAKQSWILDGFPRTADQAKFLKNSPSIDITHVLEMTGSQEAITERLSGRLFDPETGNTYHKTLIPPPEDIAARCITRKDDQPEVIARRFEEYRAQADAIREVFGDKMKTFDTQVISPDEATAQIFKTLLG